MSTHANTAGGETRSDELLQGTLDLPGVGELSLVWSSTGLVMLSLPTRAAHEIAADMVDRGIEPPPVAEVPNPYRDLLLAYAAGDDVDPATLPVDMRGSVRSYAGIAADVGSPRAMRAVGMANSANPIAIVVPCHRVVEAKLRVGGYSGGLAMKRTLLALEGVQVVGGRVIPGQLDLWDRLEPDG